MRREDWVIGHDHTARLMRNAGLRGVRCGRRPFTTVSSKLADHPVLICNDGGSTDTLAAALWQVRRASMIHRGGLGGEGVALLDFAQVVTGPQKPLLDEEVTQGANFAEAGHPAVPEQVLF